MLETIPPIINDYRLNKFVIHIEYQDGWVLYNTASGSIVFIRNEEDLRKSLDDLIKMYYYVPLSFDEVSRVDELRDQTSSAPKKGPLNGFTILTTMDCNARCFYCYEKGQPRMSMSEKVAKDVADYVKKNASSTDISIRWFGGEPLVNSTAIDIICNSLIADGIRFKSSIISNGLLFSDSIIQRAKTLWNLNRVQISLDGTKDVYQKAKAYKNAVGNEFERVIENVHKLADSGIRVTIRLNQDLYNTDDLYNLADLLSTQFKGEKHVSVYNNLLYDENTEIDPELESARYEKFKALQDKLADSGLLSNKSLNDKLRFCHCMADNDSSVVITPNGGIGICEHFLSNHLIGSIYESSFDSEEIQKWKETYPPTSKCFECPLYPQCVRIKMCPEEKEMCTFSHCENKIELIKRALLRKSRSAIQKEE